MTKAARRSDAGWRRQPVLWLGAFIFAASIGGCLLMVAIATVHGDAREPTAGREVLKMPLTREPPERASQRAAAG